MKEIEEVRAPGDGALAGAQAAMLAAYDRVSGEPGGGHLHAVIVAFDDRDPAVISVSGANANAALEIAMLRAALRSVEHGQPSQSASRA